MYSTLLHLTGAPRDRFGLVDPGLKDLDQHGPPEELLAEVEAPIPSEPVATPAETFASRGGW